jgi:hypothetical protein
MKPQPGNLDTGNVKVNKHLRFYKVFENTALFVGAIVVTVPQACIKTKLE